jgi:hypothetical protein
VTPGAHVSLDTVARYCSKAGLGSVAHCKRWLANEFAAKGRVVVNGCSLGGYKDVRGQFWCRTNRVAVVFRLTRKEADALRALAAARRAPKFPPTTKRLKRGDCLACEGSCKQRVLIEMDADLSWDGRPSPALVAELKRHELVRRPTTVRVSTPRKLI